MTHCREIVIQRKGVTSPLESGQSIYPWPSPLRTQEGGGDCHQLQSQSLSLSLFPQANWLCGFRLQSAGFLKKKTKTLKSYLFLQNLSEVSVWKHTSGNSKNEIQHAGFLKVTSLWNACLCSIWKALMFCGKPLGKHWSNLTSFYLWATMGRHLLPVRPSQIPFSISDTFIGINLIKIGGNFEEISLVQKPFFLCFKDKYSIYLEFPLSETTE